MPSRYQPELPATPLTRLRKNKPDQAEERAAGKPYLQSTLAAPQLHSQPAVGCRGFLGQGGATLPGRPLFIRGPALRGITPQRSDGQSEENAYFLLLAGRPLGL